MPEDEARLVLDLPGLYMEVRGSREKVVEVFEDQRDQILGRSTNSSQETSPQDDPDPPSVDKIVDELMSRERCRHTIGDVIEAMAGQKIKSRNEDGSQNRVYRRWRNRITNARERIGERTGAHFAKKSRGRKTEYLLPEDVKEEISKYF